MTLEQKNLKAMNQFLIYNMNVNDKNFEIEILESKLPVLIEFWASWCVPCQMMDYILNELETEYNGKIKIAKLNIDRNRVIPKKYNLTGVPTIMTIKNGEIVESIVGALSKKELIEIIKKIIN